MFTLKRVVLATGIVASLGSAQNAACRIQHQVKIVRAPDGSERASTAQIFVATTAAIDVDAKLTLASGYVPTAPPIRIDHVNDDQGPHHTVVYL